MYQEFPVIEEFPEGFIIEKADAPPNIGRDYVYEGHIEVFRYNTVYTWVTTPNMYRVARSQGAKGINNFMRHVFRNTFYSLQANPPHHRVIFAQYRDLDKALARRQTLLNIASAYDKARHTDMWATIEFRYVECGCEVKFYKNLEPMLTDHLHGQCTMEETKAGAVRIVKPDRVIRIFRITHKGTLLYDEMRRHPTFDDEHKENCYILTRLLVNWGYGFNPGDKFLVFREQDYTNSMERAEMDAERNDRKQDTRTEDEETRTSD